MTLPLITGLLISYAGPWWHTSLRGYSVLALGIAVVLALLPGTVDSSRKLLGLLLVGLVGFGGVPGQLAAVGICLGLYTGPWRLPKWSLFALAAVLAVLALLGPGADAVDRAQGVYEAYTAGPVMEQAGGIRWPDTAASIIEARKVDARTVLAMLSAHLWLSAAGVALFATTCWARPCLLLLAPLLGLALMAGTMGVRTSMFGGPAVALGVSWAVAWAAGRIFGQKRSWAVFLAVALVAVAQVAALAARYSHERPSPVMSKVHAETLVALRDVAEPGAVAWGWWDWGYATQYYAGVDTFGDGARHSGHYLWPLGMAMATPDPAASAATISETERLGERPWEAWGAVLNAASSGRAGDACRPAYLVVTWDDVRLLPWITYFGSWDSEASAGTMGRVAPVPGRFDLDLERGVLTKGEKALALSEVVILGPHGGTNSRFKQDGPALVVNELVGQAVLMDAACRNAVAMQLLFCAPDDPALVGHFRLVVEAAPLARVWKVLTPTTGGN